MRFLDISDCYNTGNPQDEIEIRIDFDTNYTLEDLLPDEVDVWLGLQLDAKLGKTQ